MTQKSQGFDTRAIHAGAEADPTTGSRQVPIYQTASYNFRDTDHAAALFGLKEFGNIYSRLTNPTVAVLESRLAALEGGVGATCAASGHAAQLLTFFAFMEPGFEFIASNKLYGGSINQFKRSYRQFDWKCHFVDPTDPENFKKALTPKVKAIFIESLSNPSGVIPDMERIAHIAHEAGIPLIVDNTIASPYLCQPIAWGADIVVHSTTKFISGNGTAMGGAVIDSGNFDWTKSNKFPLLTEPDSAYQGMKFAETFGNMAFTVSTHAIGLRDLGPCMSPMNAFLTLNGVETLSLRMERHVQNTQKVAEYLQNHPQVAWVSYAGLPNNKYHELAKKYFPKGAGAVFTFGVKGGYDAGVAFVESVKLFSHVANIGDTRSLVIHPASTTHRQLTDEHKTLADCGPDVVRLSIGLENIEDILADLDQALHQAQKKAA